MQVLLMLKFQILLPVIYNLKIMNLKLKIKSDNLCSSSKAEVIINESDIDDVFESIYTTIKTNIQKYLGKGSSRIIASVIHRTLSILMYNPLAGSSYIKLPKEIDFPRKGLVPIQHINDNECFKWRIVRYLKPEECNPARITKSDKDLAKKLEFKDFEFLLKIRNICKIEKKNSTGISVFDYRNKGMYQSMYQKMFWRKTYWVGKRSYVLIKYFNPFVYDHTLTLSHPQDIRLALKRFN